VEDAVRHRLVESAFVAIEPDVELQRFQLDAQLVRNVVEHQRREVRLSGHRTDAGELRNLHVDPVITAARWIGKCLQLPAGTGRHWLGKKRREKCAQMLSFLAMRLTQIKLSGFK